MLTMIAICALHNTVISVKILTFTININCFARFKNNTRLGHFEASAPLCFYFITPVSIINSRITFGKRCFRETSQNYHSSLESKLEHTTPVSTFKTELTVLDRKTKLIV